MRTREPTALAAALLLVCTACAAPTAQRDTGPPAPPPSPATTGDLVDVSRVVDGDTVHVTMPDGRDETIRLLGVNTPETTKGHHDCYGQQATDFTRDFTAAHRLQLTPDPTQSDRDRYGRLLRYATDAVTGADLEQELIRHGFGHEATYAGKYQRQAVYRQAQREARAAGAGGWAPAPAGCGWQ